MSIDPIKSGSFSFSLPGGLRYAGERRATKKMLEQALNGASFKGDETTPKLTGRWLKAQLAHYGIKPLCGSKNEMEERLREAFVAGKLKSQPKEIRVMEKGMKDLWLSKVEKRKEEPISSKQKKVSRKRKLENTENTETTADTAAAAIGNKHPAKPVRTPAPAHGKPAVFKSEQDTLSLWTEENILGIWNVSCPKLQQVWSGHNLNMLNMTLFRDDKHPNSIIGLLNFGLMEGVMRLVTSPSPTVSKVSFQWRGAVGEAGEIQSGENLGEIDFASGESKVKGSFARINGVGRYIQFEAIRKGMGMTAGRIDWDQFSEKAYEVARSNRLR
ncbi:hypothetical protein RUND412_010986 [Rhizina undulata]